MSQPAANGRMFALELGKFAAAFIVAIIHLTPCKEEADHLTNIPRYFAVSYFMISAIHFTVRTSLARDVGVFGAPSFQRVAMPYFAWTLVYLLLRWSKNGMELFSVGPKEWFGLLFMGQSAVQLYFLPLMLFCQIVAAAVVRTCCAVKRGTLPWGPLGWLLAAFAVSTTAEHLGYFGWSGSFAVALIYAFLALASNHLESAGPLSRRAVIMPAMLLLGVLTLMVALRIQVPDVLSVFYAPVCGFCALLLLLRARPGLPPPWMERIVSCYFGIYLMHHAFEEGAEVVLALLGNPLQPYTLMSRFVVAVLVCSVAVIITLLIRRRRTLAALLLGERTTLPQAA